MTLAVRGGSIALDSLVGIKQLFCNVSTSVYYSTFETSLGTDYQVPADHKFVISAINVAGGSASMACVIGYGDTGVQDSASPPTNYIVKSASYMMLVAIVVYKYDSIIEIPATKYPCIFSVGGTLNVNVLGYEVEV